MQSAFKTSPAPLAALLFTGLAVLGSACAADTGATGNSADSAPGGSSPSGDELSYRVLAAEERDPFTELACQLFGCPDEDPAPVDATPDSSTGRDGGTEPPAEIIPDVCGDGIVGPNEECDYKAGQGAGYRCTTRCQPKNIYNDCISSDDCEFDGYCAYGYCTWECTETQDCPHPRGGPSVQVRCNDFCLLINCASDADCPAGNLCEPEQPVKDIPEIQMLLEARPSFCRGCVNDQECGKGKTCVKSPGIPETSAGLCL